MCFGCARKPDVSLGWLAQPLACVLGATPTLHAAVSSFVAVIPAFDARCECRLPHLITKRLVRPRVTHPYVRLDSSLSSAESSAQSTA